MTDIESLLARTHVQLACASASLELLEVNYQHNNTPAMTERLGFIQHYLAQATAITAELAQALNCKAEAA